MYLKYLLIHPKRFQEKEILEACEFAQLDGVGLLYLARLKSHLSPPKEFRPLDAGHWPSQRYLLEQGLQGIFLPDEVGRKAFEMLKLPRVKEFIEAMTLVNAPLESIAHHISRTQDYYCTAQDLQRYLYFFWNLKNVDSTEIRALLEMRVNVTHCGAEIKDNHIPYLKRAFWADARKIAADMPSSPYSALVAQMKMGLMPEYLDVPKALSNAVNMLAVRILETSAGSGAHDAEKVLAYASAMRALQEITSNMQPPEEQLEKQLKALALRNDLEPIPTIQQLTDGNHTTQLLPDELIKGELGFDEEDDDVPGP